MALYYLSIPLKDEDINQLKIGDIVYFSGPVFTGRSRIHRYIFDEGNVLPFETINRNVMIHVGPIILKNQNKWDIVSFMPTSSLRFEKWGAMAVREWNLKAIIGKTTMSKKTMEAMKEYKCIHVSPQSVSPNLWIDSIQVKDVYLFDELGSIEASWQLELDRLGPFIVDIDCEGNNYFDAVDKKIAKNKELAYEKLGIHNDFEYTKLY